MTRRVGRKLDVVDEAEHGRLERRVDVALAAGHDGRSGMRRNHVAKLRHGGAGLAIERNGRDPMCPVVGLARDAIGLAGAGREAAVAHAERVGRVTREEPTEQCHGACRFRDDPFQSCAHTERVMPPSTRIFCPVT